MECEKCGKEYEPSQSTRCIICGKFFCPSCVDMKICFNCADVQEELNEPARF